MPGPTVAILTRTRNRPGYLRRCVDSVLAQTHGEWQHVIVDDAGDAAAVDAVVAARKDAYRGRVRVVHGAESHGMEAASNAGLDASDAPLVTLLDDDDTWDPAFLATAVAALEKRSRPSVRGVVTQSMLVEEEDDAGTPRETGRQPYNPRLKAVGLDALCLDNQFTNNAFVFERAVMDTIGRWDEELKVYGDWDFNLRFLLAFDLDVVARPLANYHRRPASAAQAAQASFDQIADAAETYRALLTTKWLRGEGERQAPAVATLLALGPHVNEQRGVAERLDKYLNVLHRLRRLPVFRSAESALLKFR